MERQPRQHIKKQRHSFADKGLSIQSYGFSRSHVTSRKRLKESRGISNRVVNLTVETVADFIFLGSKITTDGDYNYEIKRGLLLGRKVMTNLDSILKSRHYFANKGSSSQGYGFSSSHVWM